MITEQQNFQIGGHSDYSQYESCILEWVSESFSHLPHCQNVTSVSSLKNGVSLAEIVYQILNTQNQADQSPRLCRILDEELIEKIQLNGLQRCGASNMATVLNVLKQVFIQTQQSVKCLSSKGSRNCFSAELLEKTSKFLSSQSLVQQIMGKEAMLVRFILEVVMILPELKDTIKGAYAAPSAVGHASRFKVPLSNKSQLQDISSIMIAHSNQNINQLHKVQEISQKDSQWFSAHQFDPNQNNSQQKQNLRTEQSETQSDSERIRGRIQMQERISKIVEWVWDSYAVNLQKIHQPHLLLAELTNCVLRKSHLDPKQLPIKPIHYDLGSFSTYSKVLDLLQGIEKLSQKNVLRLRKEIAYEGNVKEETFWNLIQDIIQMAKNRNSNSSPHGLRSSRKAKSNPNPNQKLKSSQSTDELPINRKTIDSERNQNINHQNLGVNVNTDKEYRNQKSKAHKLPLCPQYCKSVIESTEIWLTEEMGMGHSLKKSQPLSGVKKGLNENPLLNGNMMARILMRLKIGSPKGIIANPTQRKHLKNNLEIVKVQFLKRGYECFRKLQLYRSSYNFFMGLISEVKAIHDQKSAICRKQIQKDKEQRKIQAQYNSVSLEDKKELCQWAKQNFGVQLGGKWKELGSAEIFLTVEDLALMAQKSLKKVKFLRGATEKIRMTNLQKMLNYFRQIGLSQYYHIGVSDITEKAADNIRWNLVADLRLLEGGD